MRDAGRASGGQQADPGPLGQLRLLAALDSWISNWPGSPTSIPIHHFRARGAVALSLNSTYSLWEYQQLHSHECQELGKALAQTQVPQQSALELCAGNQLQTVSLQDTLIPFEDGSKGFGFREKG